ncbi:MAG: DUF2344 domain-containing protein [Clostridia bacterium]|nr:DUF2344 domain-containing protein [Clostridia bacterium]
MREVRAFFEKSGCCIYMSHLDLTRCVSRAVRRAGIPIWYTEGFNPHPFFTFALPLSLGQSSVCETMDFKVVEDISDDDIVSRFNACLPDGIKIISAAEPVMKHTAICWARYEVRFYLEGQSGREITEKISALMDSENIFVDKRTKSKQIKQFDFKECVKEYKVTGEPDCACVEIILPAGCVNNVNPSLLETPAQKALGTDLFVMAIKRTGVYTADMQNFK